MPMAYSINYAQVPDFGGTMLRGEQMAQQRQMNALQMLAQQRQLDNQTRYENALMRPEVIAGMTSADPAQQAAAASVLAREGGIQGFQAAMPLITENRKLAGLQSAMQGLMGGSAPAATGAPAAPAQPTGNAPLGIRNNNPLNIRFAQQDGAEPGEGGFARFPTMEAGTEAAKRQLALYGSRGLNTIEKIVSTWAPAGDGNNNPAAYAGTVSRLMGVAPDATLDLSDPATMNRLVGAMARVELGGPIPAAASAAPAQGAPRVPTVQQLFALMTSGNPYAMDLASKLAPLVAQANPNMVQMEQGGQVYLVNPQTGQRLPMGPKNDPRGQAPAGYRFAADGRLEPIPGGPVGQENQRQDFTNTRQLREEFNASQAAKDFAIMRPNMEAIRKAVSTDSRAADIDMVFAFAKMLDPNSVVREGEQLQLMRTGGVFDTIAGYVSGLNGGGRLTPEVRANLAAQAESRFAIAADQYDDRLKYYRGLAEDGGFNPNHIGRPAQGRQAQAAPAPDRTAATAAIARARQELGAGATDDVVLRRAQEIMGR